ncbi:putative protoheme IX farnesyltransferase, mitochondrial [Glarea lozoyensis 74030]|uniref:Putative protoheme IX farnesyltransferase, mitochondrial n=1 Tax=Glarea lozoyensis (strain ATCC 74030 / MF5533) TaxID=1104152 RepID=H0EK50_GLAL7|nr:putative protoheme IX farnesyltransferase, mitochondrial [Glarea lozoyensis 74030]
MGWAAAAGQSATEAGDWRELLLGEQNAGGWILAAFLAFFPICFGLCYYNITEWTFAVASTPINVWLVREAVRFWKLEGQKGSAKGLFWASVWHLPVVMILAMVEKKGMWQRVWRAAVGEPYPDDDEAWLEEDDEDEAV